MATAIALFTRDLRVHDNPVLAAAARAEHTVPLFVLDDEIDRIGFAGRHRAGFLADCLADLDDSLQAMGAGLVVRRGTLVDAVARLAHQVDAAEVHIASDVSAYATRRVRDLRDALAGERRALRVHDGVHTVIAPGAVRPAGSDHFAVFTPYWRQWVEAERRAQVARPGRITLPDVGRGRLPARTRAPMPGGEQRARNAVAGWLRGGLSRYADEHDLLAADGTSRLSPYLHFGCVSALELAAKAAARDGGGPEAFVRQLCWRDFHAQVLAARPDAAQADYRNRGQRWRDDPDALEAWRAGHTGFPIVDAGMRQLAGEGWMHNRGRLITGSFLTKTLGIDWRAGAAHFFAHLLDGDLANNCLNWQWVAGTGNDTRPNRRLNPLRQAERFDPDGAYVRRWVPELAPLDGKAAHRPWRLAEPQRRTLDYPQPIVAPD